MRASVLLSAASLLFALAAGPALAIGEDGGGSETVTQCKKGYVWDKKKGKCEKAESGLLDDNSLYDGGRALAKAGRYEEAIAVLSLAADKNDPRILNYLGYANRKAGRLDVGIRYYEAALKADPNYTLVREYYGEAKLRKGDLTGAKKQLAEIEKRCGRDCEEYVDLSAEIAEFGQGG